VTPDRKLAIFREELRRLASDKRRRNPRKRDAGIVAPGTITHLARQYLRGEPIPVLDDRNERLLHAEINRLEAARKEHIYRGKRARRNPHPDDCGRCGGSGYSGPHGDTCSRCYGSGVDAFGSCEGGCGKSVRESKGVCVACATADDEARGIVRDQFGYSISAARRPAPGRSLGRRWNPSHSYGCSCFGCQ